jgi:hypothetical protein
VSEVILFGLWDIRQTTKSLLREEQRASILFTYLISKFISTKTCILLGAESEYNLSQEKVLENRLPVLCDDVPPIKYPNGRRIKG